MYRNYSIIDFSFCALFTTLASYAALKAPVRASVCKEFSHHPGLMRDMVEMGLNLQNCERYLEAAVFGIVGFIAILMTIRVCVLSVSPPGSAPELVMKSTSLLRMCELITSLIPSPHAFIPLLCQAVC